jgi:hypothetical protein
MTQRGEKLCKRPRRPSNAPENEPIFFGWKPAGLSGKAMPSGRAREKELETQRTADDDRRVDIEEEDSFPASDPPSHTGITGERSSE